MRRRHFITLIGGAAAWPLVARAQQPERMRRIGVLMNLAADDPEGLARVTAFAQGLQQLGWTDGRNVDLRLPALPMRKERKRGCRQCASWWGTPMWAGWLAEIAFAQRPPSLLKLPLVVIKPFELPCCFIDARHASNSEQCEYERYKEQDHSRFEAW
jgi:hypothetical protein